jgi:hypothetical protein
VQIMHRKAWAAQKLCRKNPTSCSQLPMKFPNQR